MKKTWWKLFFSPLNCVKHLYREGKIWHQKGSKLRSTVHERAGLTMKCMILVVRKPPSWSSEVLKRSSLWGWSNKFEGVLSLYGRELLLQKEVSLDHVNCQVCQGHDLQLVCFCLEIKTALTLYNLLKAVNFLFSSCWHLLTEVLFVPPTFKLYFCAAWSCLCVL